MSGLRAVTPAPATEQPTIYRSGDLVLQNPQETCIIFVSVILISALLEFLLQRIGNIDNKYARTLVTTMSQEVTIIGVLALFLMFSVSVIPRRMITPLYVNLFSWANMSLFFLATFFIITVVFQFAVAAVQARLWKTFEEGRLDTEEVADLGHRERMYRLCYDHYKERLEKRASLSTSELPFHEYIAITLRKQLVRVSNLSYRTWLSLSIAVLANFLRTMLTPFKEKQNEDHAFYNGLMFIGCIGWGTFFVFFSFFLVQQVRLRSYAHQVSVPEDGDATVVIPFGTPKRGLEFLQVIIMTYNWYVTLFITGVAREMFSKTNRWQGAVVGIIFFLPVVTFWVLLPWCFFSIAMLTAIGGIKYSEAQRISRIVRGEARDSDSDSASGSDAPPRPKPKGRLLGSDAGGGSRTRSRSIGGSSASSVMPRPTWLEDDDDWDGHRTVVPGARRQRAVEMDRTFFTNVDPTRVQRMLSQHSDPTVSRLVRAVDDDGPRAVEAEGDDDDAPVPRGKPIWWEPEDDAPPPSTTPGDDAPSKGGAGGSVQPAGR